MREALFIKRNKDRWLKDQDTPPEEPDEMAASFTQLVDDLSYAKTFYPGSKTAGFLNKQAAKIYLSIYKNRREDSSRIIAFWKYDLPLTIRKHHRTILFATAVFIVFFVVAFLVSGKDPGVARNFFGDHYVDTTLDNIENGNPFGIYEGGNPILSWLGIMINNIKVSFIFFASGLFAGIPTLYKLGETGAMVGIFDQLFAAKGLGMQFWLVVFVHGTLEITAIILSGAAGFILGMGFIMPGTKTRLQSLRDAAKDGMKIMIGITPVLVVAAFFEGLFTRLYNDLSYLTTAITTLSVLFVIWYFIIYPIQLTKKANKKIVR